MPEACIYYSYGTTYCVCGGNIPEENGSLCTKEFSKDCAYKYKHEHKHEHKHKKEDK